MAKYKTANGKGKYRNKDAKENLVAYILNPQKVKSGYCDSFGVDCNNPAKSMHEVSEKFGKDNGVQMRHIIISFSRYELRDSTTANEIAYQIAEKIATRFQCVYGVHEDTKCLHIHFGFNSVSYLNGERYQGTKQEHYALKNYAANILRDYGIRKLEYTSA